LAEGGGNITPSSFTPGKQARYPMNNSLSGLQSRSERFGEEEEVFGFEPQTVKPEA